MTHALVDSLDKVIENIARYQNEVIREPGLVGRMTMVRPWYADRANDGKWLFGPSKFVGYASCTAEAYLSKTDKRDTYRSEAVLKEWFDIVPSASPFEAEVADALRRFLNAYGHSGPRKNAWICVRKDFLAGSADSVSRAGTRRIHVDPAICGGRPHIRGTRVRVSDILDLLASGAFPADILADYPYLSETDLKAALAYGAAATSHRVILAA